MQLGELQQAEMPAMFAPFGAMPAEGCGGDAGDGPDAAAAAASNKWRDAYIVAIVVLVRMEVEALVHKDTFAVPKCRASSVAVVTAALTPREPCDPQTCEIARTVSNWIAQRKLVYKSRTMLKCKRAVSIREWVEKVVGAVCFPTNSQKPCLRQARSAIRCSHIHVKGEHDV